VGSALHRANRWYPSGTSNRLDTRRSVRTVGPNSNGNRTLWRVPSLEILSQVCPRPTGSDEVSNSCSHATPMDSHRKSVASCRVPARRLR
jgi:hypothetical protein